MGQFDQTPNARRSIYQFLAWGIAHEFSLDLVKCADGTVFGRVFQAYKNEYSAKEWLEKQFWMNANELRCFFSDLDNLQRMVETFVASIKKYCKIHQNDCPDHVVRGGLIMTHPDRPRDGDMFLAYRVKPWSKIMKLSQKLFNGAGLLFPLAALTHNGMGWLYRSVRINTDNEAFQLA